MGGARNTGALLATFTYLELRRRLGRLADGAITYCRTQAGHEVDFAVDPVLPGGTLELVQACADLGAPATRQREVRALAGAMAETGAAAGTIVTLADRETIATDAGPIRVVPAWEWALEPRTDGRDADAPA